MLIMCGRGCRKGLKMIDIKLIPKDGKWSETRTQAYYIQQIAKSLEIIVMQNGNNRTYELLEAERNLHKITKAAFELMLNKNEIIHVFEGSSIRLSDFRGRLIHNKLKIIEWISREALIEAIRKTDYLDCKKSGTGFLVKIV